VCRTSCTLAHRSLSGLGTGYDDADEPSRGISMKSTTLRSQNLRPPPLAWGDAEYAARKINADNTCDDRVSENNFDVDVEDEWVAVDRIVRGMIQEGN
jgi:hypothetical protein